jgi:trypsin
MFTTCAVWIFILTYKVELLWCRPRQLVGEVEPPWTSLLTQFENLFDDKISTVVETLLPKTPQFHSEFCGTSPVMSKVPTAKIVGGQEAKSGQFPWQAALILLPEGGRGSRLTCGGTIITARVVLTAAHCLHFPPHSYQVLVGRVSSNLGAEEAHQQKLSVVKYVKHPQFEARVYKNDIALLYVRSSYGQGMWWNDWVLPACLLSSPSQDMFKENIVGTVSGWGLVQEGGYEVSPTLQHVDVHIQNIGYCKDSFSSVTSFSEDNQFCAGEQGGGRDSCSGDSGGPFLVEEEGTGRYFVSGVVS